MTVTFADFVQRWGKSTLLEQQAAQSHFIELCQLLGHPTPTQQDGAGNEFTFEKQVTKSTGGSGRADVWYKGKFAFEYKGKDKDLNAAYAQILAYRGDLDNPPLLVVCDFLEYRIYPQWPGISGDPFIIYNHELTDPAKQKYLHWLFFEPERFLQERKAEENRTDLTKALTGQFAQIAEWMRNVHNDQGQPLWSPMQIANFLTRIVFIMFADWVGLLPKIQGTHLFEHLIKTADVGLFTSELAALFTAMEGKTNGFQGKTIPRFNGGLFKDAEALNLMHPTLLLAGIQDLLREVSEKDWSQVNPTIVGTLFERALDESKRAQLGAHYTSEADIRLIIDPVLMQPLQLEWEAILEEAKKLLPLLKDPAVTPSDQDDARDALTALYGKMVDRLRTIRVLDPACGSGNFLYVSLRALKKLEADVRRAFEPLGLHFVDVVTPRQFFGIEKNEFAAELAHVVIWIGYLQWRYENAGHLRVIDGKEVEHPAEITTPVLKDKPGPGEPNYILNDDAILRYDADGKPYEPEWPAADVIIGNPPFLGGKRIRSELKDKYVDELFKLYNDRVPHEADLVCYWFEKARAQIEHSKTKRAGLIATNSIRGGANREVLKQIKQTGDIFMAWPDQPWLLEGATVRTSLIGFDNGSDKTRFMGKVKDESAKEQEYLTWAVDTVNADLTFKVDLTKAVRLQENENLGFIGVSQHGPFEIDQLTAKHMLDSSPENNRVVKPIINAFDIMRGSQNRMIIDFGTDTSIEDAKKYLQPFEYIERVVLPVRLQNHRKQYKDRWWIHGESRPAMRRAITPLIRFIVTPRVAKHRVFVWSTPQLLPSDATVAIARDDDYFFGMLHSYLHESWALRLGTSLGATPRYTPTTTFETFPFPWVPGHEPKDDPRLIAIATAAQTLNAQRDAWLNPPEGEVSPANLKTRTLTNLYNAVESYREHQAKGEPWLSQDQQPATKIAPRIDELHVALDNAVLAAYGWSDLVGQLRTETGDELMLSRLLALNAERAISIHDEGQGDK